MHFPKCVYEFYSSLILFLIYSYLLIFPALPFIILIMCLIWNIYFENPRLKKGLEKELSLLSKTNRYCLNFNIVYIYRINNFSSETKPILIENSINSYLIEESSSQSAKKSDLPEQNDLGNNPSIQTQDAIPILLDPNTLKKISNNCSYNFQVLLFKIIY